MSAIIQILASVLNHTPDRLTVAGTEAVNVHNQLRDLPFYHTLTHRPDQLPVNVGDAVFIEADLTPAATDGQIHLRLVGGANLGPRPTRQDARGQPVLCGGMNLILLDGHLATDLQVRRLDDDTAVANFSVRLGALPGFLEVSAYGRNALGLEGGRKGDRVILPGRLLHAQRPGSGGRMHRYDRIEVLRTSVGGR